MEGNRTITEERLERYLETTSRALGKIKMAPPPRSHMIRVAEDFFNMAKSYYMDARSFAREGNYVNAYGAVNYAHGWLDAGARLGLFDVGEDDSLFTLAE